jgi:hypothetical protein
VIGILIEVCADGVEIIKWRGAILSTVIGALRYPEFFVHLGTTFPSLRLPERTDQKSLNSIWSSYIAQIRTTYSAE